MKKWLLGSMLACMLALGAFTGCTTTATPGVAQGQVVDNAAAQRAVYDAEGKYRIALIAAEAYVKLPLCDKSQPPCATLEVVRAIQKARPAARAALDAAETIVRTPGFGNDIYGSAVTAALAGMASFQKIVDTLPKK